jgi:hypothetical protein
MPQAYQKPHCDAKRYSIIKFMRFLIVAGAILAAIAVLAIVAIHVVTSLSTGSIVLPALNNATSSNGRPAAVAPTAPTSNPAFNPSGFHGPTGQPHVIGPTSNPPNY